MHIERRYTEANQGAYAGIEFRSTTSEIRNPDGSPVEGVTHTQATVPGVGYHPKHTARAWQAVLDLFGETFQTLGKRAGLAQ